MNNKKGFTLVELLAVVVILGTIATVATVSVFGIIDKQKESLLKEQIANLKDAAQSYYIKSKKYLEVCPSSSNPTSLMAMPESSLKCGMKISVLELINKNFFENKNNICDSSKSVLIYKASATDINVYIGEDVCQY